MAHDDAGDRTEQPTPRRRQEAREEGQIARSVELSAAVALLAGVLLCRFLGPMMLRHMLDLTRALGHPAPVRADELLVWVRLVGWTAARLTLPFLVLLLVLTIAGTVIQSGLVVTWKKLGIKPERLNPVEGFKRLWSAESFVKLLLGIFKVGLLAAVAGYTIRDRLELILSGGAAPPGGVYALGAQVIFDLALRMALIVLLLGLADYAWQRWRLERQLRMTKQEVRDELKRMEGDPLIKQRRRQIQQRLAMQRIRREVPRADVVVTNPTEYAVALRYDERTMSAPRVVAKGRDLLAQRIRQLAQQYGVPVVQRPALARALYAAVEVGREIPPAFYRAVAEVLAYVYQLSRSAGAPAAG